LRRTKKQELIHQALHRWPLMTTRAIARLTGTSINTVRKVRELGGIPKPPRQIAVGGRRPPGPRPVIRTVYGTDTLPDESGVLYRCFDSGGRLLFIGTSLEFIQTIAMWCVPAWYHEIARLTLTHYRTSEEALLAAQEAIREEQPRYNSAVSSRREVKVARPTAAKSPAHVPPPALPTATPGLIRRPTGRMLT
jgi:hypothetical protein